MESLAEIESALDLVERAVLGRLEQGLATLFNDGAEFFFLFAFIQERQGKAANDPAAKSALKTVMINSLSIINPIF
jgi:hypothetical protein